jgi:hypothetical protein
MLSKDGKLSIIGIFSQFNTAQLPAPLPQAFIAFEVEFNHAELNHEFTMRVEVIDADGAKIFNAASKGNISGQAKIGEKPKFANVIGVRGLTFKRAGAYNVNFWLNEQLQTDRHLSFR